MSLRTSVSHGVRLLPWRKQTVLSTSLFDQCILQPPPPRIQRGRLLRLPVSKTGDMLQKQLHSFHGGMCPSETPKDQLRAEQSHQKPKPLGQNKRPAFRRGQPMLSKCQKPVMRPTDYSVSYLTHLQLAYRCGEVNLVPDTEHPSH